MIRVIGPGDADRDFLERLDHHRLEAVGELGIIAVHSATERAIGPAWSKLGASGKTPSTETSP